MTDRMLSFDPGEHVGVALWEWVDERWECYSARECTIDEFEDYVVRFVAGGHISLVTYEIFRLGGGQEAMRQRGSTFPTVECIGVARHYCRRAGVPFRGVERGVRKATLVKMKAVGWRFPRGAGDHAWDAIAAGAAATGWRATEHAEGDGIRTRN